MKALQGVLTAMVTPFAEDGSVDEAAARSLASYLLDNGSHGLVVAGTTGESPTLTDEEQIALLRAVRDEVGGDALLICGTGTNDTRHSAELTRAAVDAGADAVLAVTPYYNKPNAAGLRKHFGAIAQAAGDVPVILYNIPSRTVVNMPPELLAELAEIANVVAVKQANNDEIGPIEGLEILAGNDDGFLRTLESAGSGGITVASHIVGPQMRELYNAAAGGDLDRAREIDAELQPIYAVTAIDTNPIPVKAACEMLGLIPSARMRLPMVEADDAQRATIRAALEAHGQLATA
ncbi:MAG: 4-hydroxy-tetrahydrodipicolinate synthase [Solirubrobacterales bacterium]|jgi:4-hydroxy-tetrahydrodipicolinate synthase|nr:4-hydroxy-tetrahydrodipicolinate synthase [Solirubrobacterales bacterium]